MAEASVGNFALLSDCHSAALVGRDGSVDWYCPPGFESPPSSPASWTGREATGPSCPSENSTSRAPTCKTRWSCGWCDEDIDVADPWSSSRKLCPRPRGR